MAGSDTTAAPPLLREGSSVFAAIAATALLVGGLAGIVRSGEPAPQAAAVTSSPMTGAAGHHGDDASGIPVEVAHGHDASGDAVPSAASSGSAAATHGGHEAGAAEHAAVLGSELQRAGEHHGAAASGDDPAAGHEAAGHGAGGQHTGGHDAAAMGEAHHATGCADDHPRSVSLVAEVQGELATTYKDVATLVALGYHPYFDSLVPGGYPPGGEGISHWINPNYIDDGVVLDPQRPETILLDNWNWPIGMMFINDPGVPPVPVYVNGDGTACSPWHPHTDAPARFGWYYYRAVYDRELEGEVPEQTPEMMHVWALPNPAGVYAAHDYPPTEVRQGAPGPLPSYFSDADVPE